MFIHRTRNILDLSRFSEEARVLNNKIISVIKFGDDDLRFELLSAFDLQEELDLDGLILNFIDADPELKIPMILDLAKSEARAKHFHNIDYKVEIVGGLVPKRTVTKGEVTRVDWYRAIDTSQVPIDKVLTVDITYFRDPSGFATYRVTNRTWINRDGSLNPEIKITPKYYYLNPADMIVEGLKRRKLLVNSIQIPVLTFMMETMLPLGHSQPEIIMMGRSFMDDYEPDFSRFIENSSSVNDPQDVNFGRKSIIVELEENAIDGRNKDYNEWLDKKPASIGGAISIRDYLRSEFDI